MPSGVTLYPKPPPPAPGNAYPYATQIPAALHCVTTAATPAKPKVSSPAPHHIYGKPSSGISSGTPVCRAQEISLSPVPTASKGLLTPSPYQQLSQHQLPPSTTATAVSSMSAPPPAHSSQSSRSSSVYSSMHLLAGPNGGNVNAHKAPISDLSLASAQTQPLDLGIKDPPVLTAAPLAPVLVPVPVATELVKRKWTDENPEEESQGAKKLCGEADESPRQCTPPPVLTPVPNRVTEPSPLMANAATTITTVANVVAAAATVVDATCASSALPEENNTAPPLPCSSPNTPAKLGPSTADSEKSNSPKPPSYGGHKLKKAWLQRHSGEDVNDDRSNAASSANGKTASSNGSLSINEHDGSNVPTSAAGNANSPLSTPAVTKDTDSALTSLNNSLNSIGSMAVNSINKAKPAKGGKKAKDRASPVVLNGHVSPKGASNATTTTTAAAATVAANSDESSSSDAETTKSSPKRLPPKVKRKKYAVAAASTLTSSRKVQQQSENEEQSKRKKLNSTSSTDSDKESASEKDSDNSSGKKTSSGSRDDKKDNSRKRGRRPKVSGSYSPASKPDNASSGSAGNNGDGGPKEKKFRDDKDHKDPFSKPTISQLKKTGESFLQDGPCFEVAPKLAKCRECRWTPNQRSRNNSNIFCRFYAFRRLRYTKNGQLAIAGFSDPHKDPKPVS